MGWLPAAPVPGQGMGLCPCRDSNRVQPCWGCSGGNDEEQEVLEGEKMGAEGSLRMQTHLRGRASSPFLPAAHSTLKLFQTS